MAETKVEIEYRWIDGDELVILEPVLEKMGAASLNHKTARALCAFQGAEMVGFFVMQLFPHVEPLWVRPQSRGMGVAQSLASQMANYMSHSRGFICIADNPFSEKMCQDFGMKLVTSPVYTA